MERIVIIPFAWMIFRFFPEKASVQPILPLFLFYTLSIPPKEYAFRLEIQTRLPTILSSKSKNSQRSFDVAGQAQLAQDDRFLSIRFRDDCSAALTFAQGAG